MTNSDPIWHGTLDVIPWGFGLPFIWENAENQPKSGKSQYKKAKEKGSAAYEYWKFINEVTNY
ncbi:MAG: hypothetical protein LBC86_08690 [Oscillospiraceae bacterium]|nr:hypothetical protein [Oscillospiraceae bacterium]